MSAVAIILMVASALATFIAFIPCLGWLNWFAIPIAAATLILGIVGLVVDKDPATRAGQNAGTYLCAIIFGALLVAVGSWRCAMGGGIL